MYFFSSLKMLSLCRNFFTINIIKAMPTSFFKSIFCACMIFMQHCPLAVMFPQSSYFQMELVFYGVLLKTSVKVLSLWRKLSSVSSLHVEYLQHIKRNTNEFLLFRCILLSSISHCYEKAFPSTLKEEPVTD